MSWRTVVISKRAKLDLRLNSMVIRNETEVKIHLSEVGVVVIETIAVSITAALLNEMTKRKIKIIFCDEERNPMSELVAYHGSHDSSSKIKKQIKWSDSIKGKVWKRIIEEKLKNQALVLKKYDHGGEADLILSYMDKVEFNDETNREGHAAKVYFNALFGKQFSRSNESTTNGLLNYGYSIFLSAINREVSRSGYLLQLGIWHDNKFNNFNLGCDLVEPFRPIVDDCVLSMDVDEIGKEEKYKLVDLLNTQGNVGEQIQYANNGMKIYVKSVFDALGEEDLTLLQFFENEF